MGTLYKSQFSHLDCSCTPMSKEVDELLSFAETDAYRLQ